MSLSEEHQAFLATHHAAAMVTTTPAGIAKVARVAVAVVDGKIWSSATQGRARTRRLRSDPRCTLFVFDAGFSWLALETMVTILEDPQVPDNSIRLFRVMQDKPIGALQWFGEDLDEHTFRSKMIEEQRIIYEFDVQKSYGLL